MHDFGGQTFRSPDSYSRKGLSSITLPRAQHLVAEWQKECEGVARPVTKRQSGVMLIGREQHEEAINDASDGRTACRIVWLCAGFRGEA